MAEKSNRMIHIAIAALTLLAVQGVGVPAGAADSAQSTSAATVSTSSDDQAIRAQADAYTQAFVRGDAKAMAAIWTEDGTYTDVSGVQHKGRAAIEKVFSDSFKSGPPLGLKMNLAIASLTFPAPDVAVEDGVCTVSRGPEKTSETRYLVVHTKKNGQWLVSAVSETGMALPRPSLSELGWLVGNWTARGKDNQVVHFQSDWDPGHHFIHCKHMSGDAGKSSGVLQIIGINPRDGRIMSWHFDTSGGIGVGHWSQHGDRWVEEAQSMQPDGTVAYASYNFHRVDNNRFTWQSTNRRINHTALPDTGEVTVTRD